ncbi:sugar ABC transporter substrate-binding protein [Streptomyces sp. NPDC058464]|uniref:sugar ABC transporter substrate-binding protein n=1 Tax=Streptomyces sp. NPDC058464 TaxID=3346511 RepID=UPI003651489C
MAHVITQPQQSLAWARTAVEPSSEAGAQMRYARDLRRTAIAAVTLGALSTLAACGDAENPADSNSVSESGNAGSDSKTIIFSTADPSAPAFQALAKGVKAYANAKGYKVIAQDPGNSAQTQLSQLESAITTGQAAGVYALMVDPKSAGPALEAAQKAGVPMVTNGVPADYGLSGPVPGVTFDGTDYTKIGKQVGTELGTCVKEKLGGKADVILQASIPGTAGAKETEAAEKAALKSTAPGARIVSEIQVTTDVAKAQTDMNSALQGHPDAQAVLGNIDEGALGALGAYEAAGKDLTCLVHQGGADETRAKAKEGKIYAIIALNFQGDMQQSMDTLFKMMKDPEATGEQLTVPVEIVRAGQ